MRNDETNSGNTGSLPNNLQFLRHGVPGPLPDESAAERERAEQTEYNLFVEEQAAGPEAEPAEETPTGNQPDADSTVDPEDRTASIARLIASAFSGIQTTDAEAAAPFSQTGSLSFSVDTADASAPLPELDLPEAEPSASDLQYAVPPQDAIAGTEAHEPPESTNHPAYTGNEPANSPQQPQPAQPGAAQKKPAAQKSRGKKAAKPGAAKSKKSRGKSAAGTDQAVTKSTAGAAVPLPGANYIKIADSNVKDTASFRQMLQDIRERQKEALPSQNTSVRSSRKRVEMRSRVDRTLNPVRYIIIGLMVLCLAGRSYKWMTLGFMGDMQGVRLSIFLTFLSMLVSWQSARRSVHDILYIRPSYETWLLVASLLTAFEALVHSNAVSLMPVLAIAWCFSGIADSKNNRTQLRADQAFAAAKKHAGLRMRKGSGKNRSLIGKAKASTYGFVRHQEEPDVFHKLWMLAGPVLFVLLLIITAFINGRTGKNFLKVLVLLMDMATPVSLIICCARPYELFSRATKRHGVVAGWFGMQELSGQRSMLIYDNDLYPTGTIKKKDIQLYAPIDINTFISYAACLGLKSRIGYQEMFIEMMREVHGTVSEVYSIRVFERGVQGRIHNETVFLGSYEFMQLEGFELPQHASRDSLFLAVGKKLMGEIQISYQVRHGASNAFRHLAHEPGLTTMVAARNFMITPGYIRQNFKTGIGKLVCLKAANRRKLANTSALENSSVCGYIFRDGIVSYGLITAGARRTWRAGFWLSVLSLASSVILVIRSALTLLQGLAMPTGTGLITLNLILLLVCELISRFAVGNPD